MNEAKNIVSEQARHEFHVKSRRHMTVDGVKEMIGFDENTVQMTTICGDMTVEGSELHINVLDVERGVVSLEGKIESIYYSDPQDTERRSFWSKLVK